MSTGSQRRSATWASAVGERARAEAQDLGQVHRGEPVSQQLHQVRGRGFGQFQGLLG